MYKVKLQSFEGPFDLLVYLIENAEMSIYDIRISEITTQYLDYIHEIMGEDADSFIERTDETGIQAYEDQVLRKKVAEAIVRAKKLFE